MATNSQERAGGDTVGTDQRIGGEPIDGDGTYPFAGLTRYDEDVDALALPEGVWDDTSSMKHWATVRAAHEFDREEAVDRDLDVSVLPERGLHTMLPELPRANHAIPAWIHPRTGEVMKTDKHNAVINPERAEAAVGGYSTYAEAIASFGHDEDEVRKLIEQEDIATAVDELLDEVSKAELEDMGIGDDALFHIAGGDHSIINPQQPLEELCEELRERDLGDKVFGEVTIDRDGGRATLDVYMDGQHVESPVFAEDREPVVVGMQIQWSFFDDWAFRVCGQALDWHCTNHIHRLTDREVVKYTGDVEGRVDWRDLFAGVLDRLDEKRDQLARVIESASNDTLDLSNLPNDIADEFAEEPASPWTALYAYMGLPNYLARHAGPRLQTQAEDAYEPNWWEIHSAATWAVSHHDKGERTAGGSYEDHARVANDMLMNPTTMEDRIVTNYEADRLDDEQSTLAEEGGGTAAIRTAFETVREKKERYEEWEGELREMGIAI